MRAVVLAAAIGAAGCVVPVVARDGPPLAWRLVEINVEGGRQLVLEREPPPRVEVRLSRERATAGEVVEAEVWLPDGVGRRRIEVRPSRPDITILGPSEFEVEGAQRIGVRFTGASPGRGGILVLVKE
jgi:hypothetical protein